MEESVVRSSIDFCIQRCLQSKRLGTQMVETLKKLSIVFSHLGFSVFLATMDHLGHLFKVERCIGTLTSQVCRSSWFVVMDSMLMETRLDGKVLMKDFKSSSG